MVQTHPVRRDVQELGEPALKADGDVAQADCLVFGLEKCTGDDADGVGEVDDPGVGVDGPHLICDAKHHRNRAQRLRETACAGGFLADATTFQRPCLVALPRRLATDAELHQHGGCAVGGLGHVG